MRNETKVRDCNRIIIVTNYCTYMAVVVVVVVVAEVVEEGAMEKVGQEEQLLKRETVMTRMMTQLLMIVKEIVCLKNRRSFQRSVCYRFLGEWSRVPMGLEIGAKRCILRLVIVARSRSTYRAVA
jgi:hypothetical protein